jgi:hypothetical protein
MDDFQFWLYVILGVVYLLSQLRKKSKAGQELPNAPPSPRKAASQPTNPRTYESKPETAAKPITFEDLLREITEAKAKPAEPASPYPMPDYPSYEEDEYLEKEDVEKEEVTYKTYEPIYKQYEEAKYKDYTKESLEETMRLENVDVKFGKFKEFEQKVEVNLLDVYTRDLRDPDGIKKAFVMSEVLRPRYF